MLDSITLLQEQAIFGGLKRATIALILQQSPAQDFPAGHFLFREGDSADAMYVVESGTVAILKQADGQQYLLRTLSNGECLGEMALIDMQPRSASALCETDCSLIPIQLSTFRDIHEMDAEQYTLIQLNMAREISRRLRRYQEKMFQQGVNGTTVSVLPLYRGAGTSK